MAPQSKNYTMRYSICISGAAAGETVQKCAELAEALGGAIASSGHTLITGATVGLPYYAALGAKKAGGMSVGFSPASSMSEHVRKYRLPHDCYDFINFTGLNYVGRDLYLVQSSDAVITVGGRFGSLHEFSSALEAHKPCGVLLGSGGTADMIPALMEKLDPPTANIVVYDTDPQKLVEQIIEILDHKFADLKKDLKERDPHWFLRRDHHSPHAG